MSLPDFLGVCLVQTNGVALPLRPDLEFVGCEVMDVESKRTAITARQAILGDTLAPGVYTANAGSWFGSTTHAEQSGFLAARDIVVSTGHDAVVFGSFAIGGVRRKHLLNLGPNVVVFRNIDAAAVGAVRIPTEIELLPGHGCRLVLDPADERWCVSSQLPTEPPPHVLTLNGYTLTLNGDPLTITQM